MRRSSLSLVLPLMLVALTGCGQALQAVPTAAGAIATRARASNELVVRFKAGARQQALMQGLGLKAVARVEGIDAVVVKAADGPAALAALRADAGVAWAAVNRRRRWIAPEPSTPELGFRAGDELLELLWGMKRIHAPEVWAATTGRRAVKVAVVDTGVDHTHPDFDGRVLKGRDFVNGDDDAMDDAGHGTHCAGTIGAGLGNGGVVGVAPNVTILAVKVLGADGWGDDAGVARGIVYAADQGAEVINLSLGSPDEVPVMNEAVAYARAKGAVVVAAMGNEHTYKPAWPAASPGAMAVGAVMAGDQIAHYTNWGPHCSVSAPGTGVLSTLPGGRWGRKTGTSMATPHVAGLAALIKSVHPDWTPDAVKTRIEATSQDLGYPGWDKFFGHGLIDAARAMATGR